MGVIRAVAQGSGSCGVRQSAKTFLDISVELVARRKPAGLMPGQRLGREARVFKPEMPDLLKGWVFHAVLSSGYAE